MEIRDSWKLVAASLGVNLLALLIGFTVFLFSGAFKGLIAAALSLLLLPALFYLVYYRLA